MSNYGPKKGGQYNVADNAKRKANNTGDQTGFGQNVNTKSYSTKSGQLSAKAQASQEQKKVKTQSGPVKVFSEEEKAALASKMGMKTSVKKAESDFKQQNLGNGIVQYSHPIHGKIHSESAGSFKAYNLKGESKGEHQNLHAAKQALLAKQEEMTIPHGQFDAHQLPGKAPLPVQIDEKKKLKDGNKTVELLDFNKSGQWSLKTK